MQRGTVVPTRCFRLLAPAKLLLLCLMAVALGLPGMVWAGSADSGKEMAARWHFNYAGYLTDIGKYLEALENYDTSLELSGRPQTKIEALMGKALLLAEYLDAPDKGLEAYRKIEKDYPEGAETALYRRSLLLIQLDRTRRAEQAIDQYLKDYPKGRYRFQTEALKNTLGRKVVAGGPAIIGIPEVRIRLSRKTSRCRIESSSVEKPSLLCASGFDCRDSFDLQSAGGLLRVNGKQSAAPAITFHSNDPIVVACGKMQKTVRGTVQFKAGKSGLQVVNRINIEDYLLSVVPSESFPDWPPEALKAQAVASRTYAFYQLMHRRARPYDLVADEGDQVYGGVAREHPNGTRAVRDTQGLVLTFEELPILAMYSANSGGFTADAGHVFDLHKPYLIAHQDPKSLKGAMARWTRRFKVAEVAEKLATIGITGRDLEDIQVQRKGPSGRAIKVKLIYQDGPRVVRTRTTVGRALRLPEILFQVERAGDEFVFQGRGFGHGVGYSQWGSRFLAEQKTYREILEFYYPDTVLLKKW